MNRWLALGIGVMVLCSVVFLGRLPEVQGQKADKASWEYKVIVSEPDFNYDKAKTDLDLFKHAAEGFSKDYNKLAEEGWELVGPIATQAGARPTDPQRTFVAFKRTKK